MGIQQNVSKCQACRSGTLNKESVRMGRIGAELACASHDEFACALSECSVCLLSQMFDPYWTTWPMSNIFAL